MASLPPLTARAAAWKTLNQCNLFRHDTADVLSKLLGRTDRPAQATDIVFGVIRHRVTLDHILKKCASLDASRVKPAQWNLLRIGTYELVYAVKTADYAIVNEVVELAGKAGSKKASGFINAVLRNIQRAIEDRQASTDGGPVRRLIPQCPGSGCLFKRDLLPNPEKEAISYFSTAFSLPQQLVQTWLGQFDTGIVREICFASNRCPSVTAQANTLCITPAALTHQLQDEGVSCERLGSMIRLRGTGRINTGSAYLNGLFFIQDPTAATAIETLAPEPGWTVLDMCAAPGGKALAAAIRMQDSGVILASDIDAKRLARVRENAKRMRFQSIEPVPAPRLEQTVRKLKRLDAIILDVPCSNTGVLARRVEARWRWKPQAAAELSKIQSQLLDKAAGFAHPGTKILYSTCSIQPGENGEQIREFLLRHNRFKRLTETLTLPSTKAENGLDCDGGYAAVLSQTK